MLTIFNKDANRIIAQTPRAADDWNDDVHVVN